MKRKIITFLSTMPNRDKAECYTYGYPGRGVDEPELAGYQTNEAPLCYLLLKNSPIDEIVYLRTQQVKSNSEDDDSGNKTTAEEYVKQKITSFCNAHKLQEPKWRAVDYEVSNPRAEERLVEVINTLSPMDEVFLDVTGGPRDVNILMLLVIRTLSYLGCHVVKTIYSDNTEGGRQIRDMGDTTRLFDMLSGMQELTSFGSVSTLRSYYGKTQDKKINQLLTAMQQLNETLTLCRTGAIKSDTARFYSALAELQKNCSDPLMARLLPVFQSKFGNKPDELSMILWCVENGMIQQALTIYTERAPTHILGQFCGSGLESMNIRIKKNANKAHKTYTDAILFFDGILKLAKCMSGLNKTLIRTTTLSHLNELLPNSGIKCDDVPWVATAGRRYLYIKLIRNMIAHANEDTTQAEQLHDIHRHEEEDHAQYCDLNALTVAQIGAFLTESVHHLQHKV